MKTIYRFNIVLLVFILFLLLGCRQELSIIQQDDTIKASLSYKKIENLEALKANLSSLKSTSKNKSFLNIDEESPIIEMNLIDGRQAYSIVLDKDFSSDRFSVRNLHVLKKGNNFSYLISEYIPDDGKPFYSIKDFKGSIVYSNINGKVIKTLIGFKAKETQSATSRQVAYHIGVELGCYAYVLVVWSDGTATIQSSTYICGGSTGSGSGSGGDSSYGGSSGGDSSGWDSPIGFNGGGGTYSDGNALPAMPVIPTEDYVEQKRFKGFFGTLTPLQQDFLVANNYECDQFFYYLRDSGFNSTSQNFVKWGINFFLLNPNIFWSQFSNWFINSDGTSRIEFNSNLNDINAKTMTTAQFVSYLQQSNNLNIEQQNDTTTNIKYDIKGVFGGINVFLNHNKLNNQYIGSSINTSEYGFTLTWSWHQTNQSIDTSNTLFNQFDLFGNVNTNLIIDGIGTIYKTPFHIRFKTKKNDGSCYYYNEIK